MVKWISYKCALLNGRTLLTIYVLDEFTYKLLKVLPDQQSRDCAATLLSTLR